MKKKHTFHLPWKAYLLYTFLVLFLLTGVTFSKYVASSQGGDEARVAKLGTLTITERGIPYEEAVVGTLVPGKDLTKDTKIGFVSKELACYVFFEVAGDDFVRDGSTYKYQNLLSFQIAEGWESFQTEGKMVYYTVVPAGETMEQAVLAEGGRIQVSKNMTAAQIKQAANDLSIKIDTTAVQYGGFASAEDAYKAVK